MADSIMIKCSMCAQDIEISMMGEHVCAIASEPTPPPEAGRTFESGADSKKGTGLLKPRLAMVDTAAANRPFLRKDQVQQLTPQSATSSYRTLSPYSSIGGRTPYDSQPLRSATAPLSLKTSSSSENAAGNLDNGNPQSGATINEPSKNVRTPNGSFLGGEKYEEPEQYAPVSPRTATGGGLLQRMNTMAPGPFDINERRMAAQRTASNGSADERRAMTNHKPQASVGSYSEDTSASDGPRKPRVERGGYGGFGPPRSRTEEPIESPSETLNRSQTFPNSEKTRIEKDDIPRPTEANAFRRLPNTGSSVAPPIRPRRPSVAGPDLSRALPPRGASFIGSRDESRLTDAGPVPGVDLASEFGVSNPYHTASESQSSTASAASQASYASSRSSPPNSISGSRRKPSNTENIISKTSQIERPAVERHAPNIPQRLSGSQDPAIQGTQFSPVLPRAASPPPLQRPAPSKNIRRPATAKGNCRACGLIIKGKSVSSADGRLSGRWHKSCFVCKTCSEPFATTSFYVLDDAPFCERHYHQLNHSLCDNCDRGIEGQYLETQRRQKYHPHCLTCSDCKRILKSDYYEMNQKVYCERDAFRRAQQKNFLGPAGTNNRLEKRSTRLLMMNR